MNNIIKTTLFVPWLWCAGQALAQDLTLSSPVIAPDSTLSAAFEFTGFGCAGENRSPELNWQNPPEGVKSYALTVYDPDAPTGSGWWHWVVVNIPASVNALPQNAGAVGGANLPSGARQISNDYSYAGWGGVCPPVGDKAHRYQFTLHALQVEKLDLPENATAALAGFMINANALATATFTAYYGR